MDTPVPSNEKHSPVLSILWFLTMILITLAIHRYSDAYLYPRGSQSLHHATPNATTVRELEDIETQFEVEEAKFLETRRLITQAHDMLSCNLRELEDIAKKAKQAEVKFLENRRRFIPAHDRALSIYPELREMHAAQCTLTPERRQIFMCAEESKTGAGEEGGCCHQGLEGA